MWIFWIVILAVAVYLFLIMPAFTEQTRKEPFLGILYAHRGLYDSKAGIPENSMTAFARAVEEGYGIETDVQMSKDGIPFLFHDAYLKRMTGEKGRLCDYNASEVSAMRLADTEERIPYFEDFLKLVNGKVPLIVELKIEKEDDADEIASVTDRYLKDYKGAYVIESFNPKGVLWYKRHRPKILRGQLSEKYAKKGPLYFALTNLLFNCMTKPDFIAYNHTDRNNLSRRLCRKLFHNLSVAWTIKSEDELNDNLKHFDLLIFDSFVPSKGPKGY